MQDLKSLKYADLRKLAKKAGIRANLKQDVLVSKLTEYFEQKEKKETKAISTPRQNADKPSTPVASSKPKSYSLNAVKNTPIQKCSPAHGTPNQLKSTPVQKAKTLSVQKTPVSTVKTPLTKVATPRQTTPSSLSKGASRWEKKVFTPKTATPASKTATPIQKVQGSGKRKQTDTPSTPEPAAKKRRSTFETAPTPDLKTPEVVETSGRRRSGRTTMSTSPGVKDMLGVMKSDMNDEEMKQSLLSAIDKKVQAKAVPAPDTNTSSIPRFAAFLKKRDEAKPITPGNKNWSKIHQKNFDKFDSIDVYLDKKRKRAEEITSSVKKAKHILAEVHTAVNKLKAHKTPQDTENKFKKPRGSGVNNKTTPFKPSVFSTNKMNFNFGATKPSPKTLPRKSPSSVIGLAAKTPSTTNNVRKSTGSALTGKTKATPFKFTAASSKKTFDIQASLAKPITWKAHKGVLKPLDAKPNSPKYNKVASVAKITQKKRDQTRVNVAARRADKKQDARMTRRGINV